MKKIAIWSVVAVSVVVLLASNLIFFGCKPAEEAFPAQDIHFIVATKAGGGYDSYARALAPVMKKYLPGDVNIIVENKAGGGGRVGYTYTYKSEPDGYTFGFCSIPGAIVTSLVKDVPYDLSKVEWLGTLVSEGLTIFVKGDSQINSFNDLKAKGETGELKCCETRIGDTAWLTLFILQRKAGLKYKSIGGYESSKGAMVGMMRGDGDFVLIPAAGYAEDYVKNGDIKPIFSATAKPEPVYPNAEYAGKLGYSLPVWSRAFFTPPGTPKSRVKILENAMDKACHDQEFLSWAKEAGRPVGWVSAAETAKQINEAFTAFTEYEDLLREALAD